MQRYVRRTQLFCPNTLLSLFEALLVFSTPLTQFVICFRNMRPPAHTHTLSGKPPAKHISYVLSNPADE